jgi:hypothetical protein
MVAPVRRAGSASAGRPGVQEFRSSGVQEFRSSGVQEFRSSGVQEFRSSGVQEFRTFFLKSELESQARHLKIPMPIIARRDGEIGSSQCSELAEIND